MHHATGCLPLWSPYSTCVFSRAEPLLASILQYYYCCTGFLGRETSSANRSGSVMRSKSQDLGTKACPEGRAQWSTPSRHEAQPSLPSPQLRVHTHKISCSLGLWREKCLAVTAARAAGSLVLVSQWPSSHSGCWLRLSKTPPLPWYHSPNSPNQT